MFKLLSESNNMKHTINIMLEITGKTNIDYIEVNLLEHNIKRGNWFDRRTEEEAGWILWQQWQWNERKFSGFCATWQHSGACGKQKRKFMGKAKMDSRITINYRISKDNNNDDNDDDDDGDIYQMCVWTSSTSVQC